MAAATPAASKAKAKTKPRSKAKGPKLTERDLFWRKVLRWGALARRIVGGVIVVKALSYFGIIDTD